MEFVMGVNGSIVPGNEIIAVPKAWLQRIHQFLLLSIPKGKQHSCVCLCFEKEGFYLNHSDPNQGLNPGPNSSPNRRLNPPPTKTK